MLLFGHPRLKKKIVVGCRWIFGPLNLCCKDWNPNPCDWAETWDITFLSTSYPCVVRCASNLRQMFRSDALHMEAQTQQDYEPKKWTCVNLPRGCCRTPMVTTTIRLSSFIPQYGVKQHFQKLPRIASHVGYPALCLSEKLSPEAEGFLGLSLDSGADKKWCAAVWGMDKRTKHWKVWLPDYTKQNPGYCCIEDVTKVYDMYIYIYSKYTQLCLKDKAIPTY